MFSANPNRPLDDFPLMPLSGFSKPKDEYGGSDWVEWEAWAFKELSIGSDLLAKFSNLQVFTALLLIFFKLIQVKL